MGQGSSLFLPFEIIMDPQEVGKIVQRASYTLHPASPNDDKMLILAFCFVVPNQEMVIGTLLWTRLQTLFSFCHF
jgi:hypothetical protein